MKYAMPLVCLVSLLAGCSGKTMATQKLDENQARVGISASSWPRRANVNTDFIVQVDVVNAGEVTLPALGKDKTDLLKVGVSYHWRQMDDKVAVWDGVFNPFTRDLKKGDDQKLELAVKAPAAPGKYILEIDALQNSAFWFSGAGSQTARMTIDIQ
jgi:hypothetical protein